jgi:hypothetical protein
VAGHTEVKEKTVICNTSVGISAIAALLAFAFASNNAHSKPKEIVVVGSKIKEQKRHFPGIVNRASAGAKLPRLNASGKPRPDDRLHVP